MFRAPGVLLVLALGIPLARAEKSPSIATLSASLKDTSISVKASASDLLNDRLLQDLQNGVPATVTYRLELIRKRPNWFDSTVGTAAIEFTASRDSITREYLVTSRRNGRLIRSDRVTGLSAVSRQIGLLELPDLFNTTRAPSKLRLRARIEYGTEVALLIVPSLKASDWKRCRVQDQRDRK